MSPQDLSSPSGDQLASAALTGQVPQLYTWGTLAAGLLMAVTLIWPELAGLAVSTLAAVPVLAALWVAVTCWHTDRRLSLAALLAVAGLAAVFLGRNLLG
ncbi:hypothetical protein [Deinococcus radiophilus]|uniref:Uncharacterized protein n=1 Tax=Deinococcus radiophilus TaxID=32062 RepID=A0A3S0KB00_9DEIO|nr:hypothetical protein [Deinococcus radiophilus]RTR26687.1 hypothetical protein EJ104_07920 [Deinococcus radiophilus]UFA50982.1 hypothetical protein LMT64_03535 [Deinococcus radiophilus]